MTKKSLINSFVIAVALLSGVLLQQWIASSQSTPPEPGIQADLHTEWAGNVVMLNFWATWCPPCREEIPDFVRLQEELGDQGLQIVGAALDTPDLVAEFMATTPINYPNFILDGAEGFAIMEQYGNTLGALPYTVFIDRDGQFLPSTHQGILTYDEAKSTLDDLLNK